MDEEEPEPIPYKIYIKIVWEDNKDPIYQGREPKELFTKNNDFIIALTTFYNIYKHKAIQWAREHNHEYYRTGVSATPSYNRQAAGDRITYNVSISAGWQVVEDELKSWGEAKKKDLKVDIVYKFRRSGQGQTIEAGRTQNKAIRGNRSSATNTILVECDKAIRNDPQIQYLEVLSLYLMCGKVSCSNNGRYCYNNKGYYLPIQIGDIRLWAAAMLQPDSGLTKDKPPSSILRGIRKHYKKAKRQEADNRKTANGALLIGNAFGATAAIQAPIQNTPVQNTTSNVLVEQMATSALEAILI